MMSKTCTRTQEPESVVLATQHSCRRTLLRILQGIAVPLVAAGVITAGSPGFGQYKIRTGDTLSDIAQRYGTTVKTLVALNNLPGNGDTIYAGETLKLPVAPKQAAAKGSRVSYIVKPGDTIGKIANRYHVSQAYLLAVNGLRRTDHIIAGRPLQVPMPAPKATKNNSFAGRTYADQVVAAADKNRAALKNRELPNRAQIRSLIISTTKRYGVDPELALAVSWQESGWNQRVVSPANAIGAMQVVPSTGRFASSIVGRNLNLLKPADNVTAGVVLLGRLTAAATLDIAVAAYYQGLGGVLKNGMYADTSVYVQNVLRIKATLEKGWSPTG
jgi:LysM repeat protein